MRSRPAKLPLPYAIVAKAWAQLLWFARLFFNPPRCGPTSRKVLLLLLPSIRISRHISKDQNRENHDIIRQDATWLTTSMQTCIRTDKIRCENRNSLFQFSSGKGVHKAGLRAADMWVRCTPRTKRSWTIISGKLKRLRAKRLHVE